MEYYNSQIDRRNFIKKASCFALGTSGLVSLPQTSQTKNITDQDKINIIGPKKGYTPQIGTMVSMLNWMRMVILFPVQGMTVEELDYLHDPESNSIGALLLHLAATERFYQLHTFEERNWGDWPEEDKKKWSVASGLGEEARKNIKGNTLDYYFDELKSVRDHTLNEFAKRDDDWLMQVDEDWPWGSTNNYCKWFHVCEHESNHNGQVKWLKSRVPS